MTDTEVDHIRRRMDERLNTYWLKMLDTEAGRAIAFDLLERCHVFRSSYTGNADTNFREGERNVGLHLLNTRILPNGASYLTRIIEEAADRQGELEEAIQREMENEQ